MPTHHPQRFVIFFIFLTWGMGMTLIGCMNDSSSNHAHHEPDLTRKDAPRAQAAAIEDGAFSIWLVDDHDGTAYFDVEAATLYLTPDHPDTMMFEFYSQNDPPLAFDESQWNARIARFGEYLGFSPTGTDVDTHQQFDVRLCEMGNETDPDGCRTFTYDVHIVSLQQESVTNTWYFEAGSTQYLEHVLEAVIGSQWPANSHDYWESEDESICEVLQEFGMTPQLVVYVPENPEPVLCTLHFYTMLNLEAIVTYTIIPSTGESIWIGTEHEGDTWSDRELSEIWVAAGTESVSIPLFGETTFASTEVLDSVSNVTITASNDSNIITFTPDPSYASQSFTEHVYVRGYTGPNQEGNASLPLRITVVYNDAPTLAVQDEMGFIDIDDATPQAELPLTPGVGALGSIGEHVLETVDDLGTCTFDGTTLVVGIGQAEFRDIITCTMTLCETRPETLCTEQSYTFQVVGKPIVQDTHLQLWTTQESEALDIRSLVTRIAADTIDYHDLLLDSSSPDVSWSSTPTDDGSVILVFYVGDIALEDLVVNPMPIVMRLRDSNGFVSDPFTISIEVLAFDGLRYAGDVWVLLDSETVIEGFFDPANNNVVHSMGELDDEDSATAGENGELIITIGSTNRQRWISVASCDPQNDRACAERYVTAYINDAPSWLVTIDERLYPGNSRVYTIFENENDTLWADPGEEGTLARDSLRLYDEASDSWTDSTTVDGGTCTIQDGDFVFVADNNATPGTQVACPLRVCEEAPHNACADMIANFHIAATPAPQDDHYTVHHGETLQIELFSADGQGVLDNDGDVNPFTFYWGSQQTEDYPDIYPTNNGGELHAQSDGASWIYIPPTGDQQTDSVTYSICWIDSAGLWEECGQADVMFELITPTSVTISIDNVKQDDPTDGLPVVTGTTQNGGTVQIVLNGDPVDTITANDDGQWQWTPAETLPPGTYTLEATDDNNHTATTDIIVKSEEDNPNEPDVPNYDNPQHPILKGKGQPQTSLTITINGIPVDDITTDEDGHWSWSPSVPMEPGTYTVVVRGADGQTSEIEVTIRANFSGQVDHALTLERPADKARTAQRNPLFVGNGTPSANVTIFINYMRKGIAEVDSNGQWQWSGAIFLPLGEHRISIYDDAGTAHTSTLFIQDPTQYTGDVRILSPESGDQMEGESFLANGLAEADSTVMLMLDKRTQEVVKADDQGAWSWTPNQTIAEGVHTLTAVGDNGSVSQVEFTLYTPIEVSEKSGCNATSTHSIPLTNTVMLLMIVIAWMWMRRSARMTRT